MFISVFLKKDFVFYFKTFPAISYNHQPSIVFFLLTGKGLLLIIKL